MKLVVLLDVIDQQHEPYDRPYLLEQVAGYCHRNPSLFGDAGYTTVYARGYLAHKRAWENHEKPVNCVYFEVRELNEKVWEFLRSSIGSWAVQLAELPDDCETTPIYRAR